MLLNEIASTARDKCLVKYIVLLISIWLEMQFVLLVLDMFCSERVLTAVGVLSLIQEAVILLFNLYVDISGIYSLNEYADLPKGKYLRALQRVEEDLESAKAGGVILFISGLAAPFITTVSCILVALLLTPIIYIY